MFWKISIAEIDKSMCKIIKILFPKVVFLFSRAAVFIREQIYQFLKGCQSSTAYSSKIDFCQKVLSFKHLEDKILVFNGFPKIKNLYFGNKKKNGKIY